MHLAFRRFLCVTTETVLLTSDLLPNISLDVGLLSVNLSLALRFVLVIYPLHD